MCKLKNISKYISIYTAVFVALIGASHVYAMKEGDEPDSQNKPALRKKTLASNECQTQTDGEKDLPGGGNKESENQPLSLRLKTLITVLKEMTSATEEPKDLKSFKHSLDDIFRIKPRAKFTTEQLESLSQIKETFLSVIDYHIINFCTTGRKACMMGVMLSEIASQIPEEYCEDFINLLMRKISIAEEHIKSITIKLKNSPQLLEKDRMSKIKRVKLLNTQIAALRTGLRGLARNVNASPDKAWDVVTILIENERIYRDFQKNAAAIVNIIKRAPIKKAQIYFPTIASYYIHNQPCLHEPNEIWKALRTKNLQKEVNALINTRNQIDKGKEERKKREEEAIWAARKREVHQNRESDIKRIPKAFKLFKEMLLSVEDYTNLEPLIEEHLTYMFPHEPSNSYSEDQLKALSKVAKSFASILELTIQLREQGKPVPPALLERFATIIPESYHEIYLQIIASSIDHLEEKSQYETASQIRTELANLPNNPNISRKLALTARVLGMLPKGMHQSIKEKEQQFKKLQRMIESIDKLADPNSLIEYLQMVFQKGPNAKFTTDQLEVLRVTQISFIHMIEGSFQKLPNCPMLFQILEEISNLIPLEYCKNYAVRLSKAAEIYNKKGNTEIANKLRNILESLASNISKKKTEE